METRLMNKQRCRIELIKQLRLEEVTVEEQNLNVITDRSWIFFRYR